MSKSLKKRERSSHILPPGGLRLGRLESLLTFFSDYGTLRKSPRKTLAALVWVVLSQQLLGLSKIGHALAMTKKTQAK